MYYRGPCHGKHGPYWNWGDKTGDYKDWRLGRLEWRFRVGCTPRLGSRYVETGVDLAPNDRHCHWSPSPARRVEEDLVH